MKMKSKDDENILVCQIYWHFILDIWSLMSSLQVYKPAVNIQQIIQELQKPKSSLQLLFIIQG